MKGKKTELPPGWGNPDDIFGDETLKTKISNIKMDIRDDDDKKDPLGGTINQTMNVSVANPGNKQNPFDNDPFGGKTIKEDPFGGKIIKEDPFGGKTIREELAFKINAGIKKSGVDPFEKGANVPDPFGGDTIKEEGTLKMDGSVKKTGMDPFAPGANISDPFGGDTI